MRLSREIRFALVAPDDVSVGRPGNSWAGWPSTNLVVPQLILRCVIDGHPDPETGFLCNIKVIDDLLRSIVVSGLIPEDQRPPTAESMLHTIYRDLLGNWNHASTIVSIDLALSPFLSYSIVAEDRMNQTSGQQNRVESAKVQLTQQFEFSAAHRLHCDVLSDEENRRLFGKCNNPAGHGHNYVVEITVSNRLDGVVGHVIELEKLESIVKQLVIDRLDHKHLNKDIEAFSNVNPTVENISIAIFDWLEDQFGDAKLEKVKVFETPKTWAEYSGETPVAR